MDFEVKDLNNGNCEIMKLLDIKGSSKDIIIPNKINGLNIISIGRYAF